MHSTLMIGHPLLVHCVETVPKIRIYFSRLPNVMSAIVIPLHAKFLLKFILENPVYIPILLRFTDKLKILNLRNYSLNQYKIISKTNPILFFRKSQTSF